MAKVYFVMGVSGSGKTTIAQLLAKKLNIPFFDGDDFHTSANKEKMAQGIPLNDEDRQSWLQTLNEVAVEHSKLLGAAIACSALKEKYRKILCKFIETEGEWIVLRGDYQTIFDRMQSRKDHYMPPGLLQSQFDAMEYPTYGKHLNISYSPEEMISIILSYDHLS